MAALLVLASGAAAQVVPPAYSGAPGTGTFLGPLANAQRTYQWLIRADQLTALVGTELTGIRYRLPASATTAYPASQTTYNSYDIRLSDCVDPANRSLTFALNVVGSQTLVRSGPLVIPANSYTVGSSPNAFGPAILFDQPYTYTGGNLLVELRHNGPGSTSQSNDAIITSTPGYATEFSACWTGSYTGTSGSQGNFVILDFMTTGSSTTGRCCLGAPVYNCIITSESVCTAQGGTYGGDGSTCASSPCVVPSGACCFADGSCQVLTQFVCGTQGGTYSGDGITCAAANCPQPGACCLPNFVCNIQQQTACIAAGGTFQGPSTTCGSCPQIPAGSVAILAATAAADVNDVQAKLVGTGLFPAVVTRILTSPAPTPTLAELQQFDAVLVWSNLSFTSGDAMGNVLADYVDAGGGVVNAIFVITTTTANRFLGGRWDSTYQIVPQQGGTTTTGVQTLGNIAIPGHPIMAGVNTLQGGNTTTTRPTTTALTPHGVLVAQWTDGKTLVAVSNTRPNRVDLGMYPPSTTANSTGWVPTTDGARLMANALLYAGGNLTPPGCYANCDGSTGSPLLTANDFQCFLNKFAANDTYANCDGSTGTPLLTANDFQCFLNKFAAGCT
jgi:hypothetical protein